MELGAIMELRVGRGSQLEEEDTPFIAEDKKLTVIHLPAHDQWYYRPRPAVLPQGLIVLAWRTAVLPLPRSYSTVASVQTQPLVRL